MKSEGPAVLSPEVVEQTERVTPANRIDPEWVANMAFAKELVTIRVNESADDLEEKQITVWNNSDMQIFPRGVEVTCERRFVESLMRSKPTKYTQKAVLDDLGKVGAYQEIGHRALKYPFQMIRDDNPLGQVWLKSILQQA